MKQITIQEALSDKEHRRATRTASITTMLVSVAKRLSCFGESEAESPRRSSLTITDFPLPPTSNTTPRDSAAPAVIATHESVDLSSHSFFRPNQPPPAHHLLELPTNRRWSFPRFTTSTALNTQSGILFEENAHLQARNTFLRNEVFASDEGIQQLQDEVDLQAGHAERLKQGLRYAQRELDLARVGIRTVVDKLCQRDEQLTTTKAVLQQTRDTVEELVERIVVLERESERKQEMIAVLKRSKFMGREALRGVTIKMMQRTAELEEVLSLKKS